MFDMSWGEVMVIGAVALIVIGPKDLPRALRTVGQVTGKLRRMAAEFQGQFQEAMREADLDDAKRQLQGINDSVTSMNGNFNPIQTIRDELKGAIETPATPGASPASPPASQEPSPTAAVSEAMAQGRGEANPPAPVDPLAALPIPSAPPIVDPAESIATVLKQEAEANAGAAQPPSTAPAAPATDKPDAKSE
ncbi:Sec-independent protein translocase protein TatB [Microvirga puerhi]|uniref:Sec-independent protein translocase protein TatB n=1 Tax=Microvirga puerhi TaxID=2876078 RepID=A0ABS7VHZ4_9HYPH|nr:Sec-independent protein translocase protein TatB [Microvirga puerhi]MBZ6074785.1 Sec-independent protein translocase protein TatB [Microvirga puerhi]